MFLSAQAAANVRLLQGQPERSSVRAACLQQGPQGPQGPQSHVHRAQGGVAEHTGQASVATPSSGQPFEKGVQSKDSGDEEKKGKKEGLRWR